MTPWRNEALEEKVKGGYRWRPMATHRIAVLPGDGIGPEVVRAALAVLEACCNSEVGLSLSFEEFSAGAGEYQHSGDPLPPATVDAIRQCDAVLLGAMGLPSVRWPNGVEMTPQLDLREQLDLYRGIRPIRLYHPEHSPLKIPEGETIDFVLVRENCEGLFSDRLEPRPPGRDFETDTMKITQRGAARICRAAFELARGRRGKLALVDKANVLRSMAFFRRVFERVGADYPEVEAECVYVDAMALFLVQSPFRYDVLVTENMFGDILSDLAAGLVGGMGLAPSADIGDNHAVFQPAHGSAPTIAGRSIANPVATILSGALLLRWLGSSCAVHAADRIERAVEGVLANPENKTVDLGGSLSTVEMTRAIVEALRS